MDQACLIPKFGRSKDHCYSWCQVVGPCFRSACVWRFNTVAGLQGSLSLSKIWCAIQFPRRENKDLQKRTVFQDTLTTLRSPNMACWIPWPISCPTILPAINFHSQALEAMKAVPMALEASLVGWTPLCDGQNPEFCWSSKSVFDEICFQDFFVWFQLNVYWLTVVNLGADVSIEIWMLCCLKWWSFFKRVWSDSCCLHSNCSWPNPNLSLALIPIFDRRNSNK